MRLSRGPRNGEDQGRQEAKGAVDDPQSRILARQFRAEQEKAAEAEGEEGVLE